MATAAPGLSDVLSSLGVAQNQSAATAGQLSGLMAQANANNVTEVGAVDQAAADNKVIQAQKDSADITAQNNTLRAATSFGTNMSDVSQIVTSLGQDMISNYQAAKQQLGVVQQIDSNASIGNPLGLVYDALYGDAERKKYSDYEEGFDLASSTLQKLNQATQQVAVTQQAIAQTKTDATSAASQDLIVQDANIKKAQLQTQLIGTNASLLTQIDSMNSQQAGYTVRAYGAQMEASRFQMDQERFASEQEDRAENRQLKLENDKQANSILSTYNQGRASLGMPPADMPSMKVEMQANKPAFNFTIGRGYDQQRGDGVVRLGQDPLSAITNIQQFRLQLPAPQQVVAQKLVGQASSVIGNPQAMVSLGIAPTLQQAMTMLADKKQLPNIQRQALFKLNENAYNNIDFNSDSSVYSPPSIGTLAGKSYLEQNQFLARNLAPSVSAGGNIRLNPSMLLTQGLSDLESGKSSTQEIADGVTWVANQMKLTMDSTNNYAGFGLPTMSENKNFNTVVHVNPGGWANSINRTIDLSDPVQVNSLLVQAMAKKNPFGKNLINEQPGGIFNLDAINRAKRALDANQLDPNSPEATTAPRILNQSR